MQKALDNANTALVPLLTEEGQLVLPFSGLQQISLFLKKERAKKDRTEIDQHAKKNPTQLWQNSAHRTGWKC